MKYTIVKRALDALDPCRLLAHGAPDDEYEYEAERIAAAIAPGDSEEKIAETATEVFTKAFPWEYSADMFRGFAAEVRNELRKSGLI